ncbi:lantibiotic dehydratase domain-containing protein [Streptomyces sp. 769]|nr:lantibiotic dehydratase domain-containing protein [Streptomyces sp. 769]
MEALDLALPQTVAMLAREGALERRLRDAAGPLSDALHDVVPTLDDVPELRRVALKARRAVHNLRPLALPADRLKELSGVLSGDAQRALAGWQEGIGKLSALRAETDARYEEETERATHRLREAVAHPSLAQGLAHASPHLLSHLTSKPLEPHSKAAKSVLGYVSRAALKTSPFSRLTALALDGHRADGAGHSYVAQQHVRSWLDALARDERFAPAFEVEPNDSIRHVGDRPYVLLSSYNGGGDTAWRSETLADASLYAPLLSKIGSWPRMTVAECLVRVGGDDPFGGYLRLLDTGWIRLVVPWGQTERRPLPALAAALGRLDHPAARETVELLRQLDSEAAQLHALPGIDRARTVERLAAHVRNDANGTKGADEDPRPTVRFAVYEDAVSDVTVCVPGAYVREDLAELGRLLRPFVFRSHLYDWLRDEFVERYGPGGRCPDVFAFLWAVAGDPGHDRKFTQALMLDRAAMGRPTDRAWLPVSASSAPPTTAVLYQVAAASADDVRKGRHRSVVNQYNPGVGGLIARFHHLFASDELGSDGAAGTDGAAGLTEHLRTWIIDAFPGAVARQVTLSGDVNGMHHAADGILPPLRWPGEPSHTDTDGFPGTRVGAQHDSATGTLELTGPDGETVAPVYLGVVPQHLIPGVARLLLCLADPWVNGSRMCCTRSPFDVGPPPEQGAVEAIVGRSHGRLVLERRAWRFAPELMPRPEPGETPATFFRRVHHWRTAHGIPDEVFLSVEGTSPMSDQAATKPLWLSFASPHAVWAAASHVGAVGQAVAVRLADAAPDRSKYWVRDGAGLRRATEHVSLLRWERPGAEPAQGEGQ